MVVQATDANGNRDYDKTGLVVMDDTTAPGDGYLESAGPNDTDEDLVQGQFIRTDMQVHRLGTYVFRVDGGIARLVKVEVGFKSLYQAEILIGLEEGDIVITDELDRFFEGDSVNVKLP